LVTASARRDKQLFRWDRRCAGSGGYAIALLASLAVTTTASPAAAAYWDDGGHKPHTAHKTHEAKAADRNREPVGQIQKGPLQIFISINQQKLHLYSDGAHVADTSIATGVPSLPTPLGVFSVIQKQVFHRSNIYNDAPMPYMQRITWSGVAMHEGESIGHRASHGCIRMPHDFAVRLYRLTKLNTRVIVANSELKPTEFADPHLFVHKEIPPEVAASPPPNGVEPAIAKPADLAVQASTLAPAPAVQSDGPSPSTAAPVISAEQKTAATPTPDPPGTGDATMQAPSAQPEDAAKELAKVAAAKKTPISIFISRKRQRLYIRQDLEPLFDTPIVIAQPDARFGTHVFTALEFTGADRTTMRWNVVSLPGEAPKRAHYGEERPRDGKHGRSRRREIEDETTAGPPPSSPAQVLARIEIPPEVSEAISQMILPGSSLIVSDQGLGDETGEGTDFIVVTR
jgi:hypothetical protein